MSEKQITETLTNAGHEVAVHTLKHPFLEQLPIHTVVNKIIKDRENLETQLGD